MGLRITTVAPGSAAEAPLAEDPRRRLERLLADGRAATATGRPADLAALFESIDAWTDADRAYEARRRLVEVVFAAQERLGADAWIELYLVTAQALLAQLERTPAEPVLLNYAGVVLHELTEYPAAEVLFAAAGRLDPELPHVGANRTSAREHRRAGSSRRLRGPARLRAAALADRARGVASRARPASGLKLSLCMIVKDEEELLPGCLESAVPYVDEMIVVDTGSSDRTVEIARSFGATVI